MITKEQDALLKTAMETITAEELKSTINRVGDRLLGFGKLIGIKEPFIEVKANITYTYEFQSTWKAAGQ